VLRIDIYRESALQLKLQFWYLPAGLREAQPCRHCFYSVVQNGFFCPQGRHVAPINVKCQISRLSGQKCGNTAPKTSKIWNFIYTRLQVASEFLVWSLSGDKQLSYKHFSSVGAFSHKFLIAPSDETTDRIKKVRVSIMVRTSSTTMPSMSWVVRRL